MVKKHLLRPGAAQVHLPWWGGEGVHHERQLVRWSSCHRRSHHVPLFQPMALLPGEPSCYGAGSQMTFWNIMSLQLQLIHFSPSVAVWSQLPANSVKLVRFYFHLHLWWNGAFSLFLLLPYNLKMQMFLPCIIHGQIWTEMFSTRAQNHVFFVPDKAKCVCGGEVRLILTDSRVAVEASGL